MTQRPFILAMAVSILATGFCIAQMRHQPGASPLRNESSRFIRIEGGAMIDEESVRTARETVSHSTETPYWTNAPGFEHDAFTFARVIFQSDYSTSPRYGFGRRLGWWVDYPDADLNLSYRLQQLTSIRTDPEARVLKLTDPDVFNFPLLYLEHAGYMVLSDQEQGVLRTFLSSGGALFVNDFWGTREWDGFAGQIARVLPGRSWTELGIDHPVFHCVFDLQSPMHRLRVPTMQFWNEQHDPDDPASPPQRISRGDGWEEMHVRALLDDSGRIMILAIHNSDVSDGWEREGENDRYFHQYSETIAYPLGINIIFYLMTH